MKRRFMVDCIKWLKGLDLIVVVSFSRNKKASVGMFGRIKMVALTNGRIKQIDIEGLDGLIKV